MPKRRLRGPLPSDAPRALLGFACLWGRQAVPLLRVCPGHKWYGPRSARSCEPSLRAVGMAGGCPRWRALRHFEGRLSSGALPPAVAVGYPRAVGAVVRVPGPGTVPLACMLCRGLRPAGVMAGHPRGVDLPSL